RKCVF
ncbi:ribosomal RNA small subunit methyltransferase E, partial [Vibrio parahaemolyticus AQ3810]